MRFHWLGKPNTVFKAKRFVRQCAHRTYVNDIAREVVVDSVLDVRGNFGSVATADDAMYAFLGQLVSYVHATITENTARHVQLYFVTDVDLIKRAPLKLITGSFHAVLVREVLQMAFSGLVANRTVQRVVNKQKLHHALAGFDYFRRGNVLNFHAVHHGGTT